MDTGKKAIALIKRLGYSIDEAAVALNVSRGALDSWNSRHDRRPGINNLLALRDLAAQKEIAITIDWFFDGKDAVFNPTEVREGRADYSVSTSLSLIRSNALLAMTLGTVASRIQVECPDTFKQIKSHINIVVAELNMLSRHIGLKSEEQIQIAEISNMLQESLS